MLSEFDGYFTTVSLTFASSVLGDLDDSSSGGKGCDAEYPDSTADYAPVPTDGTVNGVDHLDMSYLVFDPQCELAIDAEVSKEQPMSEESLRESLKKQLEFCFSR